MKIPKLMINISEEYNIPLNVIEYVVRELSHEDRHYHGLAHHYMIFNYLKNDLMMYKNGRKMAWVMLFHDIVYDPTRDDNEEQSAAIFTLMAPPSLSEKEISFVQETILATKDHLKSLGKMSYISEYERNCCLMSDLCIFWKPLVAYKWYASGIRKEYHMFSDDDYRKGRTKILLKMKEDLKIHLHPLDANQLDHNIDWELSTF